jgi:hypothetical protein
MRRGLHAYGTGPPPAPSPPPLLAPLVTPHERPLGSVCKHSELAEAPAEGACLHPEEICRSRAGRQAGMHAMAVGGTAAVASAPPVTRPSSGTMSAAGLPLCHSWMLYCPSPPYLFCVQRCAELLVTLAALEASRPQPRRPPPRPRALSTRDAHHQAQCNTLVPHSALLYCLLHY